MPTYEQREAAGYLPVEPQRLPYEPKHTLDYKKKTARLHHIEEKKTRLLDNNMPYTHFIAEVLSSPREAVMDSLNDGEFEEISQEEARHTPYKRYAS